MSRLLNQARAYTKEAQSGIYTAGSHAAGPSQAQLTEAFPRGGLGSEDPRDELMKEKMQFMKQSGSAMTPFGEIQATDEDFKWLQDKRDTEALANLDSWIGENFHVGDVTTRRWLQEVYPEYYEERERIMTERAKFALRLKLLLLRGPKNEKDLILLWGLQTGQIELDRDWDKIGPSTTSANMAIERTRFKNGLFNPLRYKTDNNRLLAQGSYNNPFSPLNQGGGGGQIPKPFLGNPVSDAAPGRYPSFLANLGI